MPRIAGRAVQWHAMGRPLELTSPDNPRVRQVQRLVREHRHRRQTHLFVVESVREMQRALEAGLALREVHVCPTVFRGEMGPLPDGVAVYHVTESLLRKMAYREKPEGLVAVFQQRTWQLSDLPLILQRAATAKERPARSAEDRSLTRAARQEELWLLAEGTAKPGNLGAMMRTAEAAGAWGVLLTEANVDIYNPNAIRASTGAVFTLPAVCGDGEAIMEFLGKRNVKLLASTPQGGVPHTDVDMTGPVAVAIGAEDRGLDQRWLDAAARGGGLIHIPMFGRAVDSLNASVAAGIVLFEAVRQRLAQKRRQRCD